MAKNHRNYEKEDKSSEIKRLKGMIRKLEHENKQLKSHLRTYDRAFHKNIEFLQTKTKQFSLEELLDGAKVESTLEEIGAQKKLTMKEMVNKWKCHKCSEGVLKIFIVPVDRYFRKCTMCDNRTPTKELTDEVER